MYTYLAMSFIITLAMTTLNIHISFKPFWTGKQPTKSNKNETQQLPEQKKFTAPIFKLFTSSVFAFAFPVKVGVFFLNKKYLILYQYVWEHVRAYQGHNPIYFWIKCIFLGPFGHLRGGCKNTSIVLREIEKSSSLTLQGLVWKQEAIDWTVWHKFIRSCTYICV